MNNVTARNDLPVVDVCAMLLEMRDNCTKGGAYDDPKRMQKMVALNAAIDIINNSFSLNTLRDVVYEDAVAHGLWEDLDKRYLRESYATFGVDADDLKRRSCAYLVRDEAFELIGADGVEAYTEELADTVIMCMSVAGYLGIDIDAAVRRKMEINKGRPWKHGKNV